MAGRSYDKNGGWHVDKSVPLPLIFALLLHAGVSVWWASGTTQRVDVLERNQLAAVPRLEEVIKLTAKVDSIQASLTEIKAALAAMAATKREPDRR